MAITEEFQLILTKTQQRRLSAEKIVGSQFKKTQEQVISRNRAVQGWSLEPNFSGQEPENGKDGKYAGENGLLPYKMTGEPGRYTFELFLTLRYHNEKNEPMQKNTLDVILNGIADIASKPAQGNWMLAMVDDQEFEPFDADEVGRLKGETENLEYAPVILPDNLKEILCQDMYGLDDHVERIVSAVRAAVLSDFEDRCHIVLVGPPGCGKTTLIEKLEAALGGECFISFDRTATTGAGAIKELDEVEVLPRFLFLDEGEKTTDTASNFLLSLTDDRSEIHKVTARKKIQRQIKLLGIACVNDEEDWQKLCKGALADRFGEPIYFSPPDHAMLRRILEREISKVPGGSEAWIDPCLNYCLKRGWDKPRKVISMLKQGREKWLDDGPGGFAAIMDRTTKPSPTVTNWTASNS